MKTRYAFKGYDVEKMARAIGKDLSISTKQSVEICNFLRNKPLSKVKELLEKIANKEVAVPYKRYKKDIPQRKGIGIGRYPVKASRAILKVIKSAEANAGVKGLPVERLYVVHLLAQRASRPMRTGRKRGVVTKRTHIEAVLHEPLLLNKESNEENKTKSEVKDKKQEKQEKKQTLSQTPSKLHKSENERNKEGSKKVNA